MSCLNTYINFRTDYSIAESCHCHRKSGSEFLFTSRDGAKRGNLNAFKFLNSILVNHLIPRQFEVKFNFACVESARRQAQHGVLKELSFVSYCIIHLIIPPSGFALQFACAYERAKSYIETVLCRFAESFASCNVIKSVFSCLDI